MTDPVARTRSQMISDLIRVEADLAEAEQQQDAEAIAELREEQEYLTDRLASLEFCFG